MANTTEYIGKERIWQTLRILSHTSWPNVGIYFSDISLGGLYYPEIQSDIAFRGW